MTQEELNAELEVVQKHKIVLGQKLGKLDIRPVETIELLVALQGWMLIQASLQKRAKRDSLDYGLAQKLIEPLGEAEFITDMKLLGQAQQIAVGLIMSGLKLLELPTNPIELIN